MRPGCHDSIPAWFGQSSAPDRSALQRVWLKIILKLTPLPEEKNTRACRIRKDPHHPNKGLVQPLQSGRCYPGHTAKTERMRQSLFFFPEAIRTVTTDLTRAPTRLQTLPFSHSRTHACTHVRAHTHTQ